MTDQMESEPLKWFDWADSVATSMAVIEAVSEIAREDATELPPLYECVDPDALDTLFSAAADDAPLQSVEFSYYGYQVTVAASGDGWLA